MPRILVAEDSPTQAEELRLILEADGFEVETAGDGPRAVRQRANSFLDKARRWSPHDSPKNRTRPVSNS